MKCPCGTKFKATAKDTSVRASPKKENSYVSQTRLETPNQKLTICVDCNAKISKRAATCPQCGSPTGQGESMIFGELPTSQAASSMAAAPLLQTPAQSATQPAATLGQRFCSSCGASHNPNQAICLKCGVSLAASSAGGSKDKNVAFALAFFLGLLGVHHFYLGSWGRGLLWLLCTLTTIGLVVTIPMTLAESISYLVMKKERFDEVYNIAPPRPMKGLTIVGHRA